MDKKAAIRAYAIVIMLMISVSGAALAPFLATLNYQQQTTNDDQAPEGAVVTCHDGGSYLDVTKTANAWWTEVKTYDWTVSKDVDPSSATLDQGSTATFDYTIEATRTVASDVNKFGVSGNIRVWNDGNQATVGLAITDTIKYQLVTGGEWKTLKSSSVDVSSKPIIPAYTSCDDNDVGVYAYNIEFTPVEGAIAYKNVATATATNMISNTPGFKTFSLPASSELTEVDKNAELTDSLVVPDHYAIVGSAPAESYSLTASAVKTYSLTISNVDAQAESVSEMTNTATVIESDSGEQDESTATVVLTAGGVLVLPETKMEVVKTGPSEALPGETISWHIVVSNTGDVQLNNIQVTDTLTDAPFLGTASLAPGASASWDVAYTIPLTTTDKVVTNTATASVDVGSAQPYVVAASAIVSIMYPGFEVSKKANVEYAVPGTTITYTVRVTNTGNVDLVDLKVIDSLVGVIVFPNVPVEQFKEVSYTYDVSPSWAAIPVIEDYYLYNEVSVTASGESEGGFEWEESGSAYIELFVPMPSIDIVKTTEQKFVCIGDTIVYDITVTNDGNTVLYDVHVVDEVAGIDTTIPELAADGGHMHYEGFFDVEEGYEFDDVVNTATAVGNVAGFREWTVGDKASVTVLVAKPDIEVTKVGSTANAVPGDVITYTVSVKNTGNWDLEGVVMNDDLKGVIDSDVDIIQGATWSTTYTYTVPGDKTEIVNTFSATYNVCEPVTKTDTWTVKVTLEQDTPMISIDKDGPCRAEIGDNVPFTVIVTNTGNVPITGVYVSDLTNGEIYYLNDYDNSLEGFVGDGTLKPEQVWILPIIWDEVFDNTELDVYVNVVQVFGMFGELNVWCQDAHAVDLIHPAISVVKSGQEMSAEGHDITYTITVTNIGDVSLYNVILKDTVSGSMECYGDDQITPKTIVQVGDYEEILIGYLGLGASKTVTYTFSVPAEWGFNYVCNEVVALGQPGPSSLWCGDGACPWFEQTNEGRWVEDMDSACTFIAKPGISVDKTGPLCVDPKIGDMTFTVTIENTGNIMIKDLYVWDNATGNYYQFFEDANLMPGEINIKTITIDWNLGEGFEGNWFDNVVEVRGDVFGDGHSNVWDDGTWSVHVDRPAILLVKDVEGADGAMPGDKITFTFYIENTGNVPLTDIMLYDEQLGDDFPMSIVDLGLGAHTHVEYVYTIPADVSGDMTNIATVWGYNDCDECYIGAFSQSEVVFFVAEPMIDVSKEAKVETVLVSETVHWEITVYNSGNVALTGVYLFDSLADEDIIVGDGNLAVGQTVVVDFYYLVTVNSPWDADYLLWNDVEAYGYYGEIEVADIASDEVFIALPSMTVEKTAASDEVCYGDVITWTVTVTNTGNVPLYDIIVNDPLTGIVFQEVVDQIGVNGAYEFDTTYDTDSAKLTDPVINHVDVAADVFGDDMNFIYGDDTSSVDVAFVDIEVEKSAPEIAVRGETITYAITVYNNGNRDAWIILNDALLGLADYEIFVVAGESWSSVDRIGFSYTVPCNAGEVLENIVTVETTYNECCGDKDTDTAYTDILEMGIRVLKTGPESAVPGEWVEFRFDVWNVGEVTLSDIVADDITLDVEFPLEGVLVPEGGLGANHAVWTYSYQIPEDFLGSAPYGWLDNHVMVHGHYSSVETSWGDGWSIWVHQPGCYVLPQ